jgi:hypothetical protein
MLFGQRFVWVTDCYAAKLVLSYKDTNPAVLRLQMRPMCWDVGILHRPESGLVNANYWSTLGTDIKYHPLLHDYLEFTMKTCPLYLQSYLCVQRICPTIAVQDYRQPLP